MKIISWHFSQILYPSYLWSVLAVRSFLARRWWGSVKCWCLSPAALHLAPEAGGVEGFPVGSNGLLHRVHRLVTGGTLRSSSPRHCQNSGVCNLWSVSSEDRIVVITLGSDLASLTVCLHSYSGHMGSSVVFTTLEIQYNFFLVFTFLEFKMQIFFFGTPSFKCSVTSFDDKNKDSILKCEVYHFYFAGPIYQNI